MFQFRPFPTYDYFIHRTLLWYCHSGFPHSEISGSKLICSYPKLIAACRVLHRLLMPRHSPCALISLTFVRENFTPLRPSLDVHPLRSVSSSSQIQTRLRWALNLLKKELFFSNLFSTIAVFKVRSSFEDHALCCLASFLFLCSVFKVHVPPLPTVVENSGIEPLTS